MKLIRYGEKNAEKPGLIDQNGHIRDLSEKIDDINGKALSGNILSLTEKEILSLPIVAGKPQQDIRLGACIADVGKFICIGLNYADHAAESGLEVPREPVVFNKWTSAISGPDDPIEIPRNSKKTDWEVELGIIIGKHAKYISEEDAMAHVAGYCVVNDVSEREFKIEKCGTWDKGKGCDTFGPIGPWLVTKNEVSDPHNLKIWLEVDGNRYQNGSTSTMIYRVPFIVSYLSHFMSLHPGDIISSGTPPGVGLGFNPPKYLKAGQKIVLGIEGLGVQTQHTVDAP